MKLIGNLKKQVEETKNKEEAKEVIEKAGMKLTDEELDQVTGGARIGEGNISRINHNCGLTGGVRIGEVGSHAYIKDFSVTGGAGIVEGLQHK